MKKMIFFFAVLLTLSVQNKLFAQDVDYVYFTAILNELLDITVTSGQNQTAEFVTSDDYNLGVDEVNGITTGQSVVTMESLGNWNVQIDAADFTDGGSQVIPIENLGVWVEAQGNYDNNAEVLWTCVSSATSQGITGTASDFIIYNSSGPGNGGDASDNEYLLHWEMGTMNGTMLGTSMFDQILAGDFGPGTYTTTVNLTMSATP